MVHFRPETAGVEGPHDDSNDGHTDAGQEEPQDGRHERRACLKTQRGRENKVPRPEKHAEQ